MSNIYDKASLVLIPSGTKTSKVYSQKPVNGDGDFTFSRSTAATRVNADGNIEKETQNLLTQSNNFDSSDWTKINNSRTGGQSGYDGTNDAWLVTATGGGAKYILQNSTSTGVHTFSLYAKEGTTKGIRISINGGGDHWANFNLDLGTQVGTAASVVDTEIVSIGSGWYRISVTANKTASGWGAIYPLDNSFNANYTAAGENLYIQDAQLEQGLVARDYIETTTAAVEGGITDNVPRLDYTDSSCPALLLEPQRTNLIGYSEYFGGSGWVNNRGTLVTNTTETLSPEGLYNATLRTNDTSFGYHDLNISLGTYSQGTITSSVFAKKKDSDFLQLNLHTNSVNWSAVKFNLATGEVAHEVAVGTYTTSGSIVSIGNGWYRCSITSTNSASSVSIVGPISIPLDGTAPSGSFGLNGGYTGSTSQSIYIYGYQAESSASYATSYIPTYGTSVTRNADFDSDFDIVSTPISFGTNDDFTFYYEGSFNDLSGNHNMIMGGGRSVGGLDYKSYWWVLGSGSIRLSGHAEVIMATASISITENTNNKLLVKRNGSVIDFFINGVKITTNQFATNTEFTFRSLGWSYSNGVYKVSGDIKQAMIFKQALTDQEAIDLTTI